MKTFLGTGWSFPPKFHYSSSKLDMVSDEEDIYQSLIILFSTTPGERITNLRYGSDLRNMIFDPINQNTNFLVKDVIKLSVLYYEPRITIDEIHINYGEVGDGLVFIKLDYTIIKTNVRSNIVFPFYKLEGTNILDSNLT